MVHPEAGQRSGPPSPASTTTSSTSNGQTRLKRARTSKPKVKTGCNNCKRRRIKCDEKRPSCTACLKSHRVCPGYPAPPRRLGQHEEIRIAPRPRPEVAPASQSLAAQLPPRPITKYQRRTTPPKTPVVQLGSITLYRPPDFPFVQQEGLYFQLFQSHTASELSGYFDSVFWSCLVLQECHSEAAIRHAVVALGALYKTLDKHCESPPSSPAAGVDPVDDASRHWEVAVKSYSNACTSLLNVAGEDSSANRTRLMASILLACFDSFIGHHKQAIKQIQIGLALLEQLRAQRRREFLSRPEEPVEDEIIQMFTRLAIQAKSYDMAFHFPKPFVIKLMQPSTDPSSPSSEGGLPVSLHQDPIPEQFSSLPEARLAWDTLCENMFRFTEILFSHASQNGPMGVLPARLRQHGFGFKSQIEAWSVAFEAILSSRTAPRVSSQEKAAIAVLKMFQIMGQILFLMTFSDSEAQFDQFEPQFKEIVDYGQEVVGDEERRAAEGRCPDPRTCRHHTGRIPDILGGQYTANHIKPSFSADLGIVPPLYVVATKCRSPVIRRQAIELLRSSSRREGMWDSELTARIGTWIMQIEEEEDLIVTPGLSPAGSFSDTDGSTVQILNENSTPPRSRQANGSIYFGDNLGPGGNARWDPRRDSQVSLVAKAQRHVVSDTKRVMIKAVEFDLRKHSAVLQCGSRGLPAGSPDLKTRVTKITW